MVGVALLVFGICFVLISILIMEYILIGIVCILYKSNLIYVFKKCYNIFARFLNATIIDFLGLKPIYLIKGVDCK